MTSTAPSPAPSDAIDTVPTVRFDTLWHVGTLNPDDKQARSLEGKGLSVSVHPEDWEAIARLGGLPTWRLERDGGAALLDWHALTSGQRQGLVDWGVRRGYLAETVLHRVSWVDCETEETVCLETTDYQQAVEEAEFRDGEDDGPAQVTSGRGWVATPTFPDPTVPAGAVNPDQILATVWVTEERPDLDGVWFEDTYHPAALSCPRGVLRPDRVTAWKPVREG